MADKLKCPFCGEELDPRFDAYHETITSWVCINEKCVSFDWEFPPKAWQALIQTQNALEMLENAAKERRKELEQNQKKLETAIKAIDCAEHFLLGVQDKKIEMGKATRSSHLLLFQLPAMAALCLNTIRDYKDQIKTITEHKE